MRIAILDDYQDQVRHLPCFALLAGHDVTILNQSEPDTTRLAALLEGMEALVLIRERTRIDEQLLMRLPTLKLISQTSKVSQHIDPALCQQYGVAVAEGIGSPIAPAELCWALIMAASRHIPAYSQALSQGQWQQSGDLGLGRTLHGLTLGIWVCLRLQQGGSLQSSRYPHAASAPERDNPRRCYPRRSGPHES